MLNWLFKKRRAADPTPTPPPAAPTAAARPAAPSPADLRAPWQARLDAACGDDEQLLAVAREAPLLEFKLAALQAMQGEAALKAAEREFRRHDRRAHQLARQRLEAIGGQRAARAKADALIESARALEALPVLPLNRLAQIDRDWSALDAGALDPAQAQAFDAARASLQRRVGEQQAQLQREREARAAASTPAPAAVAEAAAAVPPADADAEPVAGPAAADTTALEVPADAPTSIADGADEAPTAEAQADPAIAPPAAEDAAPPRRPRPPRATPEQAGRVEQLIGQAEAACTEGQLGPLSAAMAELDAAVEALDGAMLAAALRDRRQAVAGEFARLRSWQQWGSARAVDALVEAAEALAQAVAPPAPAAAPPAVPDAAQEAAPQGPQEPAQDAESSAGTGNATGERSPACEGAAAQAPRRLPALNLERHATAIRDLRARWKALAHQHAAAGAAQWKRFDAALQLAYAPIAAHQAGIDAQRRDNLAARETLLAALDALAAEPAEGVPVAEHWRATVRALEHFRADWRALGPPEHTVPRDARAPMRDRWRQATERLEKPLAAARAAAAAEREALIAAAEALAADAALPPREATLHARELQAAWAQRSRELALVHAVENALWTRFRAALDTVYARREAAAQAADAERATALAEREALIGRLAALTADTPAAELRQALADVDAAWRRGGELPRHAAAALEGRYADARAAVQGFVAGSAARRWQALCDTLADRLALCEAREAGAGGDLDARWAASGALPAAWRAAFDARWAGQAATDGTPPAAIDGTLQAAIDDTLLRLEASLELPSPAAQEERRRTLKLTALKDTLEGRTAADPEPVRRARWLQALVARPCADDGQRERLKAIVAAIRRGHAGAVDLPLPRG